MYGEYVREDGPPLLTPNLAFSGSPALQGGPPSALAGRTYMPPASHASPTVWQPSAEVEIQATSSLLGAFAVSQESLLADASAREGTLHLTAARPALWAVDHVAIVAWKAAWNPDGTDWLCMRLDRPWRRNMPDRPLPRDTREALARTPRLSANYIIMGIGFVCVLMILALVGAGMFDPPRPGTRQSETQAPAITQPSTQAPATGENKTP